MFDITLNAVDLDVGETELGGQPVAQLSFVLGIMLPLASGPGQPPLIAPSGVVRIPLDKEGAINLFREGLEVAENLPDPPKDSGLVLANNLDGVDRVAKAEADLRGNGR